MIFDLSLTLTDSVNVRINAGFAYSGCYVVKMNWIEFSSHTSLSVWSIPITQWELLRQP